MDAYFGVFVFSIIYPCLLFVGVHVSAGAVGQSEVLRLLQLSCLM